MAETDVSNGIGAEVTVTATAVKYLISPVPTNGGGNSEFAKTLKVWNTGSATVWAGVNVNDETAVTDITVPIPAGENFPFVTDGRKPIKNLVLKCATGESSTATYGAF